MSRDRGSDTGGSSYCIQGASAASSDKKDDEVEETTAAPSDEPAIDPVMQKYMEMVAQQKEKEKQVRTERIFK